MSSCRKALLPLLLCLAVFGWRAPSASADATALAGPVVADMTFSQGIPSDLSTVHQTYSVSGTMVLAGDPRLTGVYSCSFSGSGTDSLAMGEGSVSGSCSGGLGAQERGWGILSITASLLRVGAKIVLTGTLTASGVGILVAGAIVITAIIVLASNNNGKIAGNAAATAN